MLPSQILTEFPNLEKLSVAGCTICRKNQASDNIINLPSTVVAPVPNSCPKLKLVNISGTHPLEEPKKSKTPPIVQSDSSLEAIFVLEGLKKSKLEVLDISFMSAIYHVNEFPPTLKVLYNVGNHMSPFKGVLYQSSFKAFPSVFLQPQELHLPNTQASQEWKRLLTHLTQIN